MRTLDFIVGSHNKWRNITVRRGYKWADLRIDEKVLLTTKGEPNPPPYEAALIMSISIKPFKEIKEKELQHEHDASCKTRRGLFKAMQFAYPDFREEEPVVLIEYRPITLGDIYIR